MIVYFRKRTDGWWEGYTKEDYFAGYEVSLRIGLKYKDNLESALSVFHKAALFDICDLGWEFTFRLFFNEPADEGYFMIFVSDGIEV